MPTRRVVFPPSITSTKKTIERKQKTKKQKSREKKQSKMISIPSLFATQPPLLQKGAEKETETSRAQAEVVGRCLPFLRGEEASLSLPLNGHGVQSLARELHVEYLLDALGDYPARFVGLDASRPWMVYWALTGLALLGEDVSVFRRRVVATAAPMQSGSGGFGGGHGQMAHCASSYALTLSLAMVGGEEAFALIDRLACWRWLGQLKQADGGFQVSVGGEQDVRGAYCAMVMIALLDIPLELPPDAPAREAGLSHFTSGLPDYLARCQTYEGGFSGSPGTEAHGAYTYCAVACLCIMGHPHTMLNKYTDLPSLISWLSARQYAPEGGFSGRTNKLVDGCYSHWVGGCWPLIQQALSASTSESESVASLYSREGLTRYILNCCQSQYGGLRDKPGKHADSHHTCYTLAGLSSAQHTHVNTTTSTTTTTSSSLEAAFAWTASPIPVREDDTDTVYEEKDQLAPLHPLFVIPHAAVDAIHSWCTANPISLPSPDS
ncbi:farnesyltransferase subunit beta [Nannizzia gypsea CBS 118893]|uniref:Protein farnesyltransferase subunit beta n=1 Tax=Arthroderma gypseum (strain ATCC MYA-4604 / CBS 118893) TaxID=535722 RepID=E4V1K7_ARTGP|nr:farnesyltransferase subunit beta [Nannizzia gypsea CBS 118893]EFR03922.1 farnesyltransferase subunit beta [Nannizzia gypsea CBS 118893]